MLNLRIEIHLYCPTLGCGQLLPQHAVLTHMVKKIHNNMVRPGRHFANLNLIIHNKRVKSKLNPLVPKALFELMTTSDMSCKLMNITPLQLANEFLL